jgi:hypothetical protein
MAVNGMKRSWLNLRYSPDIPGDTEESHVNPQETRNPGRDLILKYLKYKPDALSFRPAFSASHCRCEFIASVNYFTQLWRYFHRFMFLIYIYALICNTNKINILPITMAARSKAWNVFALSNTGIMCSNPIQGMDVCLRLFCVCTSSGLATGWSPVQGVLPTVSKIKKLKWNEAFHRYSMIQRERKRN